MSGTSRATSIGLTPLQYRATLAPMVKGGDIANLIFGAILSGIAAASVLDELL